MYNQYSGDSTILNANNIEKLYIKKPFQPLGIRNGIGIGMGAFTILYLTYEWFIADIAAWDLSNDHDRWDKFSEVEFVAIVSISGLVGGIIGGLFGNYVEIEKDHFFNK